MKPAVELLGDWIATTSTNADIANCDWKTLHAIFDKALLDAIRHGMTLAAETAEKPIPDTQLEWSESDCGRSAAASDIRELRDTYQLP